MANAIPVLVVDDDAVSSSQLGALAKAAGYEVKTATNGSEAWELLQLARIPIVISDWYMPEMDGKELEQLEVLLPICSYCKRIRNDNEEWQPLERYIEKHFERLVTHSICPDCYAKHVQPQLDRREERPS